MQSGFGGQGYAGDFGVVVEEGEVLPGAVGGLVEEGAEGFELAKAKFKGEQASGFEGGVGGGNEPAVDVEAMGAGEESGVGFVVKHFFGHGGGFVERNVRGIGDDDVEGCEGLEHGRGKEVGLEEGDAVGEAEAGGVLLGDGERGGVEIGCSEAGGGEFGGEGERDGAGAGTDVENVGLAVGCAGGGLCGDPVEDGLYEELGFGAGDESVAGDAEVEAVELLLAGEVLDGLLGDAAGDEGAVGLMYVRGEFGVGVSDEPGAVAEEEMGEQSLGLATIDGGGGFGEGFAEGHKGRGQGIECRA